jgi:hypothetical protein
MSMRIPNRVMEHPVEALIAGVLLLGLLFGSSDLGAAKARQGEVPQQMADRS